MKYLGKLKCTKFFSFRAKIIALHTLNVCICNVYIHQSVLANQE